jgi:hypothetical protein
MGAGYGWARWFRALVSVSSLSSCGSSRRPTSRRSVHVLPSAPGTTKAPSMADAVSTHESARAERPGGRPVRRRRLANGVHAKRISRPWTAAAHTVGCPQETA